MSGKVVSISPQWVFCYLCYLALCPRTSPLSGAFLFLCPSCSLTTFGPPTRSSQVLYVRLRPPVHLLLLESSAAFFVLRLVSPQVSIFIQDLALPQVCHLSIVHMVINPCFPSRKQEVSYLLCYHLHLHLLPEAHCLVPYPSPMLLPRAEGVAVSASVCGAFFFPPGLCGSCSLQCLLGSSLS